MEGKRIHAIKLSNKIKKKKTKKKTKEKTILSNDDSIKMTLCNKITLEMMLQKIQQGKAEEENIVSSPMSINILLNMLLIGLEEGSRGQIQLMNALDLKSVDEASCVSSKLMNLMNTTSSTEARGKPILSMANGVWTDIKFPFKQQFREIVARTYQADTRSFDFINKVDQMIVKVNSWAKKRTKGLIKDLICPASLSTNTVLILANALYFKGTWEVPFHKSNTRESDFYGVGGKIAKVPFMNKYFTYYFCRSFDGFKLLKLPYQSSDDDTKGLSMYVFLPDKMDGLKDVLEEFNSDPSLIHTTCKKLEREKLCNISIPKFKFSCSFEASDVMSKMGIDVQNMGELTNIVDSIEGNKVHACDMIQKSYIEVNETGTEAASASYLGGAMWCLESPMKFVADHPFFFAIKDDITGVTLFNGVVCNPLLS